MPLLQLALLLDGNCRTKECIEEFKVLVSIDDTYLLSSPADKEANAGLSEVGGDMTEVAVRGGGNISGDLQSNPSLPASSVSLMFSAIASMQSSRRVSRGHRAMSH